MYICSTRTRRDRRSRVNNTMPKERERHTHEHTYTHTQRVARASARRKGGLRYHLRERGRGRETGEVLPNDNVLRSSFIHMYNRVGILLGNVRLAASCLRQLLVSLRVATVAPRRQRRQVAPRRTLTTTGNETNGIDTTRPRIHSMLHHGI